MQVETFEIKKKNIEECEKMEQSMALSHSHQRSFNCYSCAMREISLQNGAKQ